MRNLNIPEAIIGKIRNEFFALRNGMIADTLRRGGLEQKYIFGLQLPQIKGIAEKYVPEDDAEAATIARSLWSDRECREARLLACHMMPKGLMTIKEAMDWAEDVGSREEADILAFRLLRYHTGAEDIANALESDENPLKKYTASAIKRFF